MPVEPARLEMLSALARKVLWLSSWTIHHANHIRPNTDGLKVGGHQASSASLATIMSALYFSALRPQDRVAVKPHASPVFHAIQYLFGQQTRDKLENFRGFKGAQSYPSRTEASRISTRSTPQTGREPTPQQLKPGTTRSSPYTRHGSRPSTSSSPMSSPRSRADAPRSRESRSAVSRLRWPSRLAPTTVRTRQNL